MTPHIAIDIPNKPTFGDWSKLLKIGTTIYKPKHNLDHQNDRT